MGDLGAFSLISLQIHRLWACCSTRSKVVFGNGRQNSKMIADAIWLVLSWKVTYKSLVDVNAIKNVMIFHYGISNQCHETCVTILY